MYPHQHGDEENRFQQGESESFDRDLCRELRKYLESHNKEQPSEGRHSRPLQGHNDREQPSGDRHSRPLRDPNGGEQPSGDKPSESEAGK